MTKYFHKLAAIGLAVSLTANNVSGFTFQVSGSAPTWNMKHETRNVVEKFAFGSQALAAAVPSCMPRLRGLLRERFLSWGAFLSHQKNKDDRWVPAELLERYPADADQLKRLCNLDILDSLALINILKEQPGEFDAAMDLLAKNSESILAALEILGHIQNDSDGPRIRTKLKRSFAASPLLLFSALNALGERAELLLPYFREDGDIELDRFLQERPRLSITLYADGALSHYSARRLIDLLNLEYPIVVSPSEKKLLAKGGVAISFDKEFFETTSDGQRLSVPPKIALYHSMSPHESDGSSVQALVGIPPPSDQKLRRHWLSDIQKALKRFEENEAEARLCAAMALAGAILRQEAADKENDADPSVADSSAKPQARGPFFLTFLTSWFMNLQVYGNAQPPLAGGFFAWVYLAGHPELLKIALSISGIAVAGIAKMIGDETEDPEPTAKKLRPGSLKIRVRRKLYDLPLQAENRTYQTKDLGPVLLVKLEHYRNNGSGMGFDSAIVQTADGDLYRIYPEFNPLAGWDGPAVDRKETLRPLIEKKPPLAKKPNGVSRLTARVAKWLEMKSKYPEAFHSPEERPEGYWRLSWGPNPGDLFARLDHRYDPAEKMLYANIILGRDLNGLTSLLLDALQNFPDADSLMITAPTKLSGWLVALGKHQIELILKSSVRTGYEHGLRLVTGSINWPKLKAAVNAAESFTALQRGA